MDSPRSSLSSASSSLLLHYERPLRPRRRVGHRHPSENPYLGTSGGRTEIWARWIVLVGCIIAGMCIVGLALLGYFGSNRAKYMQVLDGAAQLRDWDSILQTDGSFEGSFDQAVDSDHVAWVADSMLHIRPTWIDETPGDSQAVPHVQTAKLRSKASVTFGKARVTAKFPKGDWLWSTISLEPAEDSYGSFPGSGRIDLAQIRGNGRGFLSGGIDKADHLIHYGAAGILASDCAYKDRNVASLGVTDFGAGFHTFGVEWTPAFIRIWLDYPSNTMLHSAFPRGFWRKTGFSLYLGGDPRLTYSDPWTNGTRAAPFDVAFHLVIRVNAGSVGGIFADVDEKPWYDAAGREAAMHNFNLRNQTWRSTWGKPEQHTLQIKSAMMFQQLSADSSWAS